MALRKVYIYDSEETAQDAVELLNAHYQDELDGVKTKTWVTYFPFGEQWVINYNDSLYVVLGDPVEVEVEEDVI